MAVEQRRGCGYRKVGGTYLEADPGGFACGRLPLELKPCPLCDQRPAFVRSMQRITPRNILHARPVCAFGNEARCRVCPLNDAVAGEMAALLWVGARFYTPAEFTAEAGAMGVSKRVPFPLPKWFEVGKTWVFVAHEQAISAVCDECRGVGQVQAPEGDGEGRGVATKRAQAELFVECPSCEGDGQVYTSGVFHAFVPQRIVRIVADTMPEAEREVLRAQGLTLVEVPAADPDHQSGSRREEE